LNFLHKGTLDPEHEKAFDGDHDALKRLNNLKWPEFDGLKLPEKV